MKPELDIDLAALGLQIRGRPELPLTAEVVRELTPEDWKAATAPREEPMRAPEVKVLRERHHRLARLLAEGVRPSVAATAVGYSSSRVSILKSDPAFQELLAFYSEKVDTAYTEMHEAMAMVGRDAVSELAERLETEPESFTHGQLMELTKVMADRTGHGPSTKTEVNLKVGLADRLQEARRRLTEQRMIDITPEGSAA